MKAWTHVAETADGVHGYGLQLRCCILIRAALGIRQESGEGRAGTAARKQAQEGTKCQLSIGLTDSRSLADVAGSYVEM